jgi:hypothetical protein
MSQFVSDDFRDPLLVGVGALGRAVDLEKYSQ